MKIAHLPTVMLAVGYLIYWIELYLLNRHNGTTTVLAWVVFIFAAGIFMYKEKIPLFRKEKSNSQIEKFSVYAGMLIATVILLVAFVAALYPPHLIQESDTMMYHIMLPRQHLIWGSFKHLTWSAADFFIIPLDYALAPYWLSTPLPNKFPQFLIALGLVAVTCRLTAHFNNSRRSMLVAGLAVLGSHHVGMQLGTSMMDLAIVYLFLAALDSLLSGRIVLFSLEAAFFLWSKSFIPVQMGFIAVLMLAAWLLARKSKRDGLEWSFGLPVSPEVQNIFGKEIKKILILLVVFSLLIGGPFAARSLFYAGTPFYPLFQGLLRINPGIDPSSEHWQSIKRHARYEIDDVKDAYGHGRGPVAFLKHIWLISVPEKDVNNSYDYPLGLVYLLVVGPFLVWLAAAIYRKKWPILSLFIVFYWISWWLGSHQSRFLYVPVLLMLILVIGSMKRLPVVFYGALLLALLSTALSVVRAHKGYLGKPLYSVLRERDHMLLEINEVYVKKKIKGPMVLNFHDVAYARFPVVAQPEAKPFTLAL